MCVGVREREKESVRVCVCECVCVKERERESLLSVTIEGSFVAQKGIEKIFEKMNFCKNLN